MVGITVQVVNAEQFFNGYKRLFGVGGVAYRLPEGRYGLPPFLQGHVGALRLRDDPVQFQALDMGQPVMVHREAGGLHQARRHPRRYQVAGIVVGEDVAEVHGIPVSFCFGHDVLVGVYQGDFFYR